jgi:hypothetical protein
MTLTIYLDQMKWIDLARAETGHAQGAAHAPALEAFKRAVDEGRARFPLSVAHYLETGKQHDRTRREQLVGTMMRLAGMYRISPPHVIVPWEIRRALIGVFELDVPLPDLAVLGDGAAHATNQPSLRYTAPTQFAGVMLTPEMRYQLEEVLSSKFEMVLLGELPPNGMPEATRILGPAFKDLDARFVDEQNRVGGWAEKLGRSKLENLMAATAMIDIMAPLIVAAQELQVPLESLVEAKNVFPLLEHMPSRWVEMKLRHLRQSNPQKRWHVHDLNDVTALAIAIPYCDVVVTEKSWSAMLNDAKVPTRYDTIVTRSLEDVVAMLETSAAGAP